MIELEKNLFWPISNMGVFFFFFFFFFLIKSNIDAYARLVRPHIFFYTLYNIAS